MGLAAGFQRIRKQFDPVPSPKRLAIEHIDRRAKHAG